MKKCYLPCACSIVVAFINAGVLRAAVQQLNSPSNIITPVVTLSFEGYSDGTVANSLFNAKGVNFSRDDGQAVLIGDWSALGRETTSPSNVLCTVWRTPINSGFVTHLNATFATPLFAVGAFFGNDQAAAFGIADDFTSERLSAFDSGNHLVGSVSVSANQNTSVDQFIGLQSDLPFTSVRFENLSAMSTPCQDFAVVLDDLVFAPIPEPSTFGLLASGILAGWKFRRLERKRYRMRVTGVLFRK